MASSEPPPSERSSLHHSTRALRRHTSHVCLACPACPRGPRRASLSLRRALDVTRVPRAPSHASQASSSLVSGGASPDTPARRTSRVTRACCTSHLLRGPSHAGCCMRHVVSLHAASLPSSKLTASTKEVASSPAQPATHLAARAGRPDRTPKRQIRWSACARSSSA